MLRICLTGGICSGKTTVANLFAELGAPIIDTDIIAREIVEPGTASLTTIVEHFTDSILLDNGELNRKKLRQLIFNDPIEKKWLEELLHPEIRVQVHNNLNKSTADYAIVVVPLYAESDSIDYVDSICVVDCEPTKQIARLMQRDHCSRDEAENIIAQQATREQRLELADDVIMNNEDIDQLRKTVRQLDIKWRF
ncbi:MAG: dephospho-CoA kinase [Gammaproteobacteria bacterium RIFCSPHIGHO2_12_FULL_41_15]|nr:MAG: dephospho-CoA kinase [Gammaproteobacteria bacterium RIFCSPHIGHO2_12_FULL_41_15]